MRKKNQRPRAADVAIISVVLVVKNRDEETLQAAYRDLRYNDFVRKYFPRFVYHNPCQSVIQQGRVMFEGPEPVVKTVLSDLTGGSKAPWTQGTGEDLRAEQEALAARRARRQETAWA